MLRPLLGRPLRLLLLVKMVLLLQLLSPVLILENALVQIILLSVNRLVVVQLDVVVLVSNHVLVRRLSLRELVLRRGVGQFASLMRILCEVFLGFQLFGRQLLLALNCWPVDSVSNRFSTTTENWERVKKRVIAKNLSKIFS